MPNPEVLLDVGADVSIPIDVDQSQRFRHDVRAGLGNTISVQDSHSATVPLIVMERLAGPSTVAPIR